MPMVPKISAGRGTIPGEARTMPTRAVNTINRLTLGLVSSRKSRQRLTLSAVMGGLFGAVDTAQGYHADRGGRPQCPEQPDHAAHQERSTGVVQRCDGQRDAEMHGCDAD